MMRGPEERSPTLLISPRTASMEPAAVLLDEADKVVNGRSSYFKKFAAMRPQHANVSGTMVFFNTPSSVAGLLSSSTDEHALNDRHDQHQSAVIIQCLDQRSKQAHMYSTLTLPFIGGKNGTPTQHDISQRLLKTDTTSLCRPWLASNGESHIEGHDTRVVDDTNGEGSILDQLQNGSGTVHLNGYADTAPDNTPYLNGHNTSPDNTPYLNGHTDTAPDNTPYLNGHTDTAPDNTPYLNGYTDTAQDNTPYSNGDITKDRFPIQDSTYHTVPEIPPSEFLQNHERSLESKQDKKKKKSKKRKHGKHKKRRNRHNAEVSPDVARGSSESSPNGSSLGGSSGIPSPPTATVTHHTAPSESHTGLQTEHILVKPTTTNVLNILQKQTEVVLQDSTSKNSSDIPREHLPPRKRYLDSVSTGHLNNPTSYNHNQPINNSQSSTEPCSEPRQRVTANGIQRTVNSPDLPVSPNGLTGLTLLAMECDRARQQQQSLKMPQVSKSSEHEHSTMSQVNGDIGHLVTGRDSCFTGNSLTNGNYPSQEEAKHRDSLSPMSLPRQCDQLHISIDVSDTGPASLQQDPVRPALKRPGSAFSSVQPSKKTMYTEDDMLCCDQTTSNFAEVNIPARPPTTTFLPPLSNLIQQRAKDITLPNATHPGDIHNPDVPINSGASPIFTFSNLSYASHTNSHILPSSATRMTTTVSSSGLRPFPAPSHTQPSTSSTPAPFSVTDSKPILPRYSSIQPQLFNDSSFSFHPHQLAHQSAMPSTQDKHIPYPQPSPIMNCAITRPSNPIATRRTSPPVPDVTLHPGHTHMSNQKQNNDTNHAPIDVYTSTSNLMTLNAYEKSGNLRHTPLPIHMPGTSSPTFHRQLATSPSEINFAILSPPKESPLNVANMVSASVTTSSSPCSTINPRSALTTQTPLPGDYATTASMLGVIQTAPPTVPGDYFQTPSTRPGDAVPGYSTTTPLHCVPTPSTLPSNTTSNVNAMPTVLSMPNLTLPTSTPVLLNGANTQTRELFSGNLPTTKQCQVPQSQQPTNQINILPSRTPDNTLLTIESSAQRMPLPNGFNNYPYPLNGTVRDALAPTTQYNGTYAPLKRAPGRTRIANHISSGVPAGESTYLCDVCNKVFPLHRLLKRHMKCHNTLKRYHCAFCNKGFNDTFDLKRHVRTHTGVRPYKCDECSKAFTQRCSLESHLLKVHGKDNYFTYKERRNKIFVCEECGHTTKISDEHYDHIRDNHPESGEMRKYQDKMQLQKLVMEHPSSSASSESSGGSSPVLLSSRSPDPGSNDSFLSGRLLPTAASYNSIGSSLSASVSSSSVNI